jgi:dihydrofolate reductase
MKPSQPEPGQSKILAVGGSPYDQTMTKVVFHTATTINGFLADEGDSLQWLFDVPTDGLEDGDLTRFMPGVGAIVMGSTTYNWVVDFEDLMQHPEKWQPFYGDRPTWVFSGRERRQVPGANLRFVSGDVTAAWPEILDSANGGDVWVMGGGELVGQFIDAGLLDEMRLSVAPATLTSGRPLLPRNLGTNELTLTAARQVGAFAELIYEVRR